jgi:hypothetical protein
VVSYTPFQFFDVDSFHEWEHEDVLGEPLDALGPSCYNKCDDVIDNIDEFTHVARCKWDVIFPNGYLVYNIECHFQFFPLQQPYVIVVDLESWQHEDDMIRYLFQPPKDDLLQHSHEEFWSYPRGFDTFSFEHLYLFHKEDFQPPI